MTPNIDPHSMRGQRRPRGRDNWSGPLKDMVLSTGRGPATEERDLIIGKAAGQRPTSWSSALPATSCCSICPMPATPMWLNRLYAAIGTLPANVASTITWEQGIPTSFQANFTIATAFAAQCPTNSRISEDPKDY